MCRGSAYFALEKSDEKEKYRKTKVTKDLLDKKKIYKIKTNKKKKAVKRLC